MGMTINETNSFDRKIDKLQDQIIELREETRLIKETFDIETRKVDEIISEEGQNGRT